MPMRLIVAAGTLLTCLLPGTAAERPKDNAELAAWVEKTVEERQPTAEERRFDEIGWLTDIREAIRLAKQHKRPVMLFTHDGRMAIGRC